MSVSELLNDYFKLPHYTAERELVDYVDGLEEKLLLVNRTLSVLLNELNDCPLATERLADLLDRLDS